MHQEMIGPASQARQFRDSRGRQWHVYERQKLEPLRGSVMLLIFESDAALRVVRSYPDDWHSLEAAALEELSWRV